MSTFNYETPASIGRDASVVKHFRVSPPDEFLTKLNLDLGTALTAQDFLRIQVYFANTAMRDPTVGELRLLDALCQRSSYAPDHIAVGELTTASAAVAETWADMMAKHAVVGGSSAVVRIGKLQTPPCSLSEALLLTGRYLRLTGMRPAEDILALSDPREEAAASAEGYTPIARIQAGHCVRSLWKRMDPPPTETPCRAGDMILYLPRLSLKEIQSLVASEAARRNPAVGAVRALTEKCLLSTILELCPAADIHAARLPGAGEGGSGLPISVLCGRPSVSADGSCGYVLRVPFRRMPDLTRIFQDRNIPFIPCGQAKNDGNVSVLLPDLSGLGEYPAVSLSPDLLQVMSLPRPCAMNPEALAVPTPAVTRLPLSLLPTAVRESNGLTPDGREAVALTVHEAPTLTVPLSPTADARIAVLSAEIPTVDAAYSAAAETTAAAALSLERDGIPPAAVRLSVSMSVAEQPMLTDGPALSAICGVYCAAAQLAVPVETATIEVSPSPAAITLTVTALATAPHADAAPNDRQWRISEEAVHKESPAYFFPVLRRICEGSLLSLSAALNRNGGAACSLCPLAVQSVNDEETGAPRHVLHQDSLRKLLRELNSPSIPVFSLNREDTRLLLSHPDVMDSLRRRCANGWSTLALGDSCAVFAEYGLLPATLAQTRVLPRDGHTATVTYPFPAPSATRLLRADLLTPANTAEAMETRHLIELELPNGARIPDGFVSADGKVLGLLNGLDTTLLPRAQQPVFDLS